MHLAESEQILESILAPIVEAAFARRLVRIVQRAEEPIPNRQVGEILRVMSILMVDPMRFGSLHKMANPARRPDVPMVEVFGDRAQECVVGGCVNVAPEERVNDCTADERIEQNFDGMFIEARQ